jgi:protease I
MTDEARVALLIEDGFDDDEVERITAVFRGALHAVRLVAPFANRAYQGRQHRLTLTSDLAASSVRAATFAAIVIPGGYAPDRIRMRHAMLDVVRDALARGIPVGAIGHGAQVLISAGVIAGRTVTCWPSIAVDVKNAGGLYVDRPVVADRGVFTARKIDDVEPFVQALLDSVSRAR